jgi:hypothetical protein
MTQQLPSNHELVLRKLANEHEVAMYKAQTERLQAQTGRFDAQTRRIWAVGWLVLSLTAPILGYTAGAGAIARDWLVARVGAAGTQVPDAPAIIKENTVASTPLHPADIPTANTADVGD